MRLADENCWTLRPTEKVKLANVMPCYFLPNCNFCCRKKVHFGKSLRTPMPKSSTLAKPKPASSMSKLADKPGEVYLPKSDNQKIMELKRLLIDGAGQNVVGKALQIALDDNHPAQAAMIKLCMDRMLPISLFEKGVAARSAVTINITGIGDAVSIGGDTLDLASHPEPIDVTPINHTGAINKVVLSNDSGHSHSMDGAMHKVEIQ